MNALDHDTEEYHTEEYHTEEYHLGYSDTLAEVKVRMVQREIMIQQLTAQLLDESIPTSLISQLIEQLNIYQELSEQDINTMNQTSEDN